jgi:probable FeS assembly SUF system protein SufT
MSMTNPQTVNTTPQKQDGHKAKQPSMVLVREDCPAVLVPTGVDIELKKGTEVLVTQSLGGSFTLNVYGNLVRVANAYAQALGLDPLPAPEIPQGADLKTTIYAMLKTCYDPEIPVNIVDLGLIYGVNISPISKFEQHVKITMTLTAPGCGMGPVLLDDVKRLVDGIEEVVQTEVDLVFDPPWDKSMMSEAAQLSLSVY